MSQLDDSMTDVDLTILSSLLTDMDKLVLVPRYLDESQTSSPGDTSSSKNSPLARFHHSSRKLLDTFADSLKHVNKLYNQLYGFAPRKVPAHMPHLIDRDIMSELQSRFASEYEHTSSARFRRSNDMQYAFAYYYHVMSEVDELNMSRLFDELDTNENERIDESELMVASVRMWDRPFSASDLVPNLASVDEMRSLHPDLVAAMNECGANQTSTTGDEIKNIKQFVLDRETFVGCEALSKTLKPTLWLIDSKPRMRYRFEVLGDEETRFIMVAGEPIDIEVKLANYMRVPRKFLCLNDNIDYVLRNEAQQLKQLLRRFFNAFYPLRSSFELSVSEENNNEPVVKSTHRGLPGATSSRFGQSSSASADDFDVLWLLLTIVFIIFVAIFLWYFLVIRRRRRSRKRSGNENLHAATSSSSLHHHRHRHKRARKVYKMSEALRNKMASLLGDDDDDDDDDADETGANERAGERDEGSPTESAPGSVTSSSASSCAIVDERSSKKSPSSSTSAITARSISGVPGGSKTSLASKKHHSKRKTLVI